MLKKVVTCLGFGRCFSRTKKNDIGTRYMYDMDSFQQNRDVSLSPTSNSNGEQKVILTLRRNASKAVRMSHFHLRRGRNRGNFIYQ